MAGLAEGIIINCIIYIAIFIGVPLGILTGCQNLFYSYFYAGSLCWTYKYDGNCEYDGTKNSYKAIRWNMPTVPEKLFYNDTCFYWKNILVIGIKTQEDIEYEETIHNTLQAFVILPFVILGTILIILLIILFIQCLKKE